MKIQYASDLHLEFAENHELLERGGGIVPGNHEFYQGYDIGQTLVDYEFEYRENIRYLNNASVMLDDTELFFTTLWTRISPLFLREIQRGMNDFRYGVLDGERFTANDVDGLHRRCVEAALRGRLLDLWAHALCRWQRYGDWRDATALQPTWVCVLWREQGLSAGCGGRGIDYLSQSLIQ